MLPAAHAYRRAADLTAQRLGRVVLGYLAVVVAIITLAPFRFAAHPVHGLSGVWTTTDLVMNVVMFIPLGFVYQLTRPQGAPLAWKALLLLGGGLSGAIELLQVFEPNRYPSLFDLATNTGGAVLGAWLFARLSQRVRGDDAVQSLALELPLMGLVYLLVPLCWLIGLGSEQDARRVLVLLLACIAGAIIGTVHTAYLMESRERRDQRWMLAACTGWACVALAPAARQDPMLFAAGLALALGAAFLRSRAALREGVGTPGRRFEQPTLRAVLPVYTVYLALSAIWPVDGATPAFRGTVALTMPGVEITNVVVFRLLEQVAAFTLVGYMSAEYYGRDPRELWRTLPSLIAWTLVTATLLQLARGFHLDHGASLSLLVLTQLAAGFGHWVYALQRAHIQALSRRRRMREAFRRAAGVGTGTTKRRNGEA